MCSRDQISTTAAMAAAAGPTIADIRKAPAPLLPPLPLPPPKTVAEALVEGPVAEEGLVLLGAGVMDGLDDPDGCAPVDATADGDDGTDTLVKAMEVVPLRGRCVLDATSCSWIVNEFVWAMILVALLLSTKRKE